MAWSPEVAGPSGGADLTRWWLAASIIGILTGAALSLAGETDAANLAWAVTTGVGILPLGWETIRG